MSQNPEPLSKVLTELLDEFAGIRGTRLATMVNERGLLRTKLTGKVVDKWIKGENKKPRDWQPIAAIADALRLSKANANRLLASAGKDDVALLLTYCLPKDRPLLTRWLAAIPPTPLFSELEPLAASQRQDLLESKAVSAVGINLFRFLPAFQLEFRTLMERGGKVRLLMTDPESDGLKMAALRSESRTPFEIQVSRIVETIKLLKVWKQNMPGADIELRLIDYIMPYGITIIDPTDPTKMANCLVRLYTFRTSTTTAPAIAPSLSEHEYWLDFFTDQFEKMWEAGETYDLAADAD